MSQVHHLAAQCLDNDYLAEEFGRETVKSVKAILGAIGQAANEYAQAWLSTSTITELSGVSERTIRDLLPKIVDAGLIKREMRTRDDGSHGTPVVTLLFIRHGPYSARALKATGLLDMMAGKIVPGGGAVAAPSPATVAPRVGRRLQGGGAAAAPLTSFEPPIEPESEKEGAHRALLVEMGEGERVEDLGAQFEALCAVWAEVVIKGRNSRPASFDAWTALTPEERAALPTAVRVYAEAQPWGSAGPPALQRWISDAYWRDFVGMQPGDAARPAKGSGKTKPPPAPVPEWPGDPAVRRAVVAARDEAFARSYLDPATPGEGAIFVRTAFAAEKLREVKALAAMGLTVAVGARDTS